MKRFSHSLVYCLSRDSGRSERRKERAVKWAGKGRPRGNAVSQRECDAVECPWLFRKAGIQRGMMTLELRMKTVLILTAVVALSGFASSVGVAQHGMPGGTPMTFFVTSVPIGDGGNLGGLAGADAHCQKLAQAVGAGNRTWRAYLSTQARPGQPAVNARDRIGKGPWYNFDGVMIARDAAHLHGDTIELARLGNNLTKRTGLTEKGQIVPGLNDYKVPRDSDWEYSKTTPYTNRHEMLTGSQLDGRAYPPGFSR